MRLSRRTLLVATGTSIAVAGCLGNGDDPEDDDEMAPTDDDEEQNGDEEELGDDEENGDEPEAETVVVGPDGDHRFDPDTLEIDPGTTVEFVWEDSGHNIAVTDQPEEGDWEGVSELADEGHTHEHTFEIDGQYEYICEPHADGGMEGVILVGDGDETDDTEEDDDDDDGGNGGY
ncbi:plastocyanin/azurin family copper-binding protein [Natrialbaceae archaeon A-CW3]